MSRPQPLISRDLLGQPAGQVAAEHADIRSEFITRNPFAQKQDPGPPTVTTLEPPQTNTFTALGARSVLAFLQVALYTHLHPEEKRQREKGLKKKDRNSGSDSHLHTQGGMLVISMWFRETQKL